MKNGKSSKLDKIKYYVSKLYESYYFVETSAVILFLLWVIFYL